MNIYINHVGKIDELQFRELLQLCREEEYLVRLLKSTKLQFAISASYGEKLVGVIMAWRSDFHPYCTYFRILSNPFYSNLYIEEKLFEEAEKFDQFKTTVQTSIWETATSLKMFYENSGFKEIRRTYMPVLKLKDIAGVMSNNSFEEDHSSILPLAEIFLHNSLKQKLLQLVKFNYEQTHLVNPVAEMDLEMWEKTLLEDDILLKGSYVCLNGDGTEFLAYSFLHESERSDTLEFGWCGSADKYSTGYLRRLVYDQIVYAKKHGIQFIQGEFDTTSEFAMEVMKSLPFEPCPTWITYQKE